MKDYIIRDCGLIGFLGIYMVDGKEVYRTGKHYQTELGCLCAMIDFIEERGE